MIGHGLDVMLSLYLDSLSVYCCFLYACTALDSRKKDPGLEAALQEFKGKITNSSINFSLLTIYLVNTMVEILAVVSAAFKVWEHGCVVALCMLSLLYAFLEYLDFLE